MYLHRILHFLQTITNGIRLVDHLEYCISNRRLVQKIVHRHFEGGSAETSECQNRRMTSDKLFWLSAKHKKEPTQSDGSIATSMSNLLFKNQILSCGGSLPIRISLALV